MSSEKYYSYADQTITSGAEAAQAITGNPRQAQQPSQESSRMESAGTQAAAVDQTASVPDGPAILVYSLDQLSMRRPGPVLAVGYGNTLKNIVRAANTAEVQPLYTTGTDDKLRAFSFGNTATVISLGKKFQDKLFSNDFAVLNAIDAAGARSVLWAQPTPPSDLVLAEAERRDILLIQPRSDDRSLMLWERPEISAEGRAKYASRGKDYEIKWRKCPHCGLSHDDADSAENGWCCPDCGKLYRLTSDERIGMIFDEGSFEEWDVYVDETDPMGYPDYDAVLARAHERSGYDEAVRCGCGRIEGHGVAVAIMEPSFMMGSMGSVVGEKITRMIERATEAKLPVVIFCASGGARMQEGLASLMQMAKISAAIEAHDRAGLLYVSVLTDPTTGGVTASFAMLGDIILSEPGALIGFAGRRVIQDTIKQALPDDFQTADFALEHGLIDAIVPRDELRAVLGQILDMHDPNAERHAESADAAMAAVAERAAKAASGASELDSVKVETADGDIAAPWKGIIKGLSGLADSLGKSLSDTMADASLGRALRRQGVADAPYMRPHSGQDKSGVSIDETEGNRAWESVKLARNAHRPTALYYIDSIVEGFIEFHGDRAFADDGAIVGGIGKINGRPVTIVAEEKGSDLKARIARNFGSPQPEGYRKAQRLMKQADKFGRPIVCFVDTQGAYCGTEAEERGMGNAIAESLALMAGLGVPVISVVLGEGGSGGALALAVANRVAMQENAVYSVLSPEGFASILWKDGSRAPEAAAVMKMSAADALEMGMIEDVIPEGHAPAHENPEQAAAAVWLYITNALEALSTKSSDELRAERYARFRAF